MNADIDSVSIYRIKRPTKSGGADALLLPYMKSPFGNTDIIFDFANLPPEDEGGLVRIPRLLAEVWDPPEVLGRFPEGADFADMGFIPVFNGKAVETLKDILLAHGEVLPLRVPAGTVPLFAYHITTTADILDAARSEVEYAPAGMRALDIHHHEFRPDAGPVPPIFKIPLRLHTIYVSDEFVSRVKAGGLRGFQFTKVWPVKRKEGKPVALVAPSSPRIFAREFAAGEEFDSVHKALQDYPRELGWDVANMGAGDIQARILEALIRIKAAKMKKEEKLDQAFWLAFAWGETLVKELSWEWAMLDDGQGAKTPAVCSPNRSHAVPVLQFMGKLATTQEDQTSLLLYNMILANDIGKAEPGELSLLS